MNWEALEAIGTLIGAIGVVITLIYLSIQIRQNTRSQQSAIAQVTSSSRTAWYELGASDPEFTLLYTKGHTRPDELTDDERVRFIWMLARVFSTFEEMYSQYKLQMFDEPDWERYRKTARTMIENPIVRDWWESGATVFTNSFIHDITPDVDVTAWSRESIIEVTVKKSDGVGHTDSTTGDA
jgi:hypothetical protein